MKPAELLYSGRITQESRSGHTNPVVKLFLLCSPLSFVMYQQVGRLVGWPRLAAAKVVIVALALFWASILNFRDRELSRTIKRGITGALFFGGLFFVTTNPESPLTAALGFVSMVYHAVPILRDVAPESWLYLVFFYIAITAVNNFNTRDTLWLGRRLLLWWDRLYVTYVVIVITFCVIHSALPLRVGLSWSIASDKAALLNNPYRSVRQTWLSRRMTLWRIFGLTTIGNNSSIAQAIELLCEQRGFFRIGYRDVIGRDVAAEDVAAIAIISIAVLALIMFQF